MSGRSAEEALDALLVTLQRGDLSPLEFRMLRWLADRVGTQSELAEFLDVSRGAIGRAARRLSLRGLIGRRFERGRRYRFALSITSTGLAAVAPLVEWITDAHPAEETTYGSVLGGGMGWRRPSDRDSEHLTPSPRRGVTGRSTRRGPM